MKGLYLVTPDWDDTERLVAVSQQAIHGGAGLLQYRHKTASEPLRQEQATALLKLCRRLNVPLIINDHLELCEAIDADGIHVGGTDASVASMRARLGSSKIVGASCYGDLQLARDAQASGASYVAFGGFYPSRVKKYAVTTVPNIITLALNELNLPICVIGGMTPENSRVLIDHGAHMVAAISSVYSADDPHLAATQFSQMFR
jgi:thiamine-phosphate pyrophosphorylase